MASVVCRRSKVFRPLLSFARPRIVNIGFCRRSVTVNPSFDKTLDKVTGGRLDGWLKTYEEFVGLAEVRIAQGKVIQLEEAFAKAQHQRRENRHQITHVQNQLRAISTELEKVRRGEEMYLTLLKQEHEIIKEERRLMDEAEMLDQEEKEKFSLLSSAVRESHEKERARAERTKYWSIILSVTGAVIGVVGTSINNYLRMRELRGIVIDSAGSGTELRGLVNQLAVTISSQHNQIQGFVTELKAMMGGRGVAGPFLMQPITEDSADQLETKSKEILTLIKQQEQTLQRDMTDIKAIIASSKAENSEGNVVYVGPEMENMLENTEKSLEWKIKLNALWSVCFIYGAFALTLPVLYSIFRGS